ncbi:MAG TPA: hypothetical protein VGC07_05420 [Granulicella sp.]
MTVDTARRSLTKDEAAGVCKRGETGSPDCGQGGQGDCAGAEAQRDDIRGHGPLDDGLRDGDKDGVVAAGHGAVPVVAGSAGTVGEGGRAIEVVHRSVGGGVDRLGQCHVARAAGAHLRGSGVRGAEELGAAAIIVEGDDQQVKIRVRPVAAQTGDGLRQRQVAGLLQHGLQRGQLVVGAVLRAKAGEVVQNAVAEGAALGKDRGARGGVVEEGENLAEGQVFDEAAQHDAAAGVGRDEVEVLQDRAPRRSCAVERNQRLDLNESPASASVEREDSIAHTASVESFDCQRSV